MTTETEPAASSLHDRIIGLLSAGGPEQIRAALVTVLERHAPLRDDWGSISCACWSKLGHPAWPCSELKQIIMALSEETE